MLLDFLGQFFFSFLFLIGIAGVGIRLLRWLRFEGGTVFLIWGMGYFISLCLYTFLAVLGLFLFPEKLFVLTAITYGYMFLGWLSLALQVPVDWRDRVRSGWNTDRRYWTAVLVACVVSVGLFFLQVYHTSILDEWLHRPVVQSFLENGTFPLINPLNPQVEYIYTYHYGTQIIGAGLNRLFHLDVSASLDLFKLSVFEATFFLFLGLLQSWLRNRWVALAGSVLLLFCGSSFFLVDTFTTTHVFTFWNLPAGQRWPINMPLSYGLTGITWVNIPMTIAFCVLIETLFLRLGRKVDFQVYVWLAFLLAGFFLISELFAVLIGLGFVVLAFVEAWRTRDEGSRNFWALLLFVICLTIGVYFTGGIVGDFLRRFLDGMRMLLSGGGTAESHGAWPQVLGFKTPGDWGYPTEKHILSFWNAPLFYLRSLFLETLVVLVWLWLWAKKRLRLSEHPLLLFLSLAGLFGPFFFTTEFGDLNLAKTSALSFVLLHLMGFYLLSRILERQQVFTGAFLVLLLFGSVSGLLVGPNIQWAWASGKGKGQACSQNPDCYKGDFVSLLRDFERAYPGVKRVALVGDDASRVVDLTNSYVYIVKDLRTVVTAAPEARFIFDSSEACAARDTLRGETAGFYPILMAKGKYCIRSVESSYAQ